MGWCYLCNKQINDTVLDTHVWCTHGTNINEDPNITQVQKEDTQKLVRSCVWNYFKSMAIGYTAFKVLFTKPRYWGMFTRIIAVGAGYYGVRKAFGIYTLFNSKKKSRVALTKYK